MKSIFDGIFGGRIVFMVLAIVCAGAVVGKHLGLIDAGGTEMPLLFFGVTALSEGNNLRDVVRHESGGAGLFSRKVVTLASGQNLVMGAVIGKITKSIPTTGTAAVANNGAGTVGTVTGAEKTKIGEYQIKCLTFAASPLAATFEVTDPDGLQLPEASLAAYTSDQINFTVANSSPAITVGDIWTITVTPPAAGTDYVKEIQRGASTAVDGSQNAYGILTADCDASLGAKSAVAIVKDAVIISANLTWPDGSPAVSDAEKVAALVELAGKGIVARSEA